MSERLVLATAAELLVCAPSDDRWRAISRSPIPKPGTCVAAAPGAVLVGSREGIFRAESPDGPWEERAVGEPYLRWIAFHPDDPSLAFAGTEPAALFRSDDGGRTWIECAEVARLREARGFHLPYSPRAGCVRSFAFHGDRGYAAVEVGGVLRSDDRGRTWRMAAGSTEPPHTGPAPAPPAVHPDVHSVALHPSSADRVFAATHGGLYRSADGGATWARISGDVYCRALWLDPADPDHVVFGPATRAGWNGFIQETFDGGRRWETGAGVEMPWHHEPIERFAEIGGDLLAFTDEGRVLARSIGGGEWRQVLAEVPGVVGVAAWRG